VKGLAQDGQPSARRKWLPKSRLLQHTATTQMSWLFWNEAWRYGDWFAGQALAGPCYDL